MNSKRAAAERKFLRDQDKKAALSEAEQARRATQKKTAKLRELRLAKEAAERGEHADSVKPDASPADKRKQ